MKAIYKAMLEITDRLDREINFAGGLAAVIRGLECMDDGEQTGAQELAEVHIERLKAIGADLAQSLRK